MTHPPPPAADNRLLAGLPLALRDVLRPHLEPVSLRVGEVLYEPGQYLEYIHFPTTAIISLVYTVERGATTETGLVGNEGAAGISVILGGDTASSEALVVMAGEAYRMRTQALLPEFQRNEVLRTLLLRYIQALITQISQNAVCNRLHQVDVRLCRWLLLARDRVQTPQIRLTHEFIGNMLGVRRECVTHAAHRLQQAGLIRNGRGKITILDVAGLEAAACECYRVVRSEFDRMLEEQAVS